MEVTAVQSGPDIINLLVGLVALLGFLLALFGSTVYFWKYFVGWIKPYIIVDDMVTSNVQIGIRGERRR